MSKFLTAIRTSSAIEEVILKAQKEIVLLSPHLRISKCEEELPVICNAITQFASIFASLNPNFQRSNVS